MNGKDNGKYLASYTQLHILFALRTIRNLKQSHMEIVYGEMFSFYIGILIYHNYIVRLNTLVCVRSNQIEIAVYEYCKRFR